MFVKPALQAVLRVFGLCGSRVVLVWVVLWFLVTCGFLALVCASDRAHVIFVGRWSCLDADDCASTWRRSLWICGSVVLPALMRVLLLFVDC